jgi:hypothetical protein
LKAINRQEETLRTATATTARLNYGEVSGIRIAQAWPRLPNSVWLAMIVVAAAALAFATIVRSSAEVRNSRRMFAQSSEEARQAGISNQRLRDRIQDPRKTSAAADRIAQDRMTYLRSNEIVIAVK